VIIALTASVFADQHAALLQLGINGIISKPYRIEEIFTCLHDYLKVQFIYQQTEAVVEPPLTLSVAHFKQLPHPLQTQLHDAALQLDIEQTTQVINQIASHDKNLANQLQQRVEEMDFQAILDITT